MCLSCLFIFVPVHCLWKWKTEREGKRNNLQYFCLNINTLYTFTCCIHLCVNLCWRFAVLWWPSSKRLIRWRDYRMDLFFSSAFSPGLKTLREIIITSIAQSNPPFLNPSQNNELQALYICYTACIYAVPTNNKSLFSPAFNFVWNEAFELCSNVYFYLIAAFLV